MTARPARKNDEHALVLPGLEGSPLPTIAVGGAEHLVRYANPAFCQMSGKSYNELIGKRFSDVVPSEECESRLNHVYRTGEAVTHSETKYSEPQHLYWSYSMWQILDADGRPAEVVFQINETARFHRQAAEMNEQLLLASVRQHELTEVAEHLNTQLQLEIAERKRMESVLLSSARLAATTRLADTMAHEINNPLAAITNLVYLLGPMQTSPSARLYIEELEKQVRGISLIASQMLKFHRDGEHPAEFKLSSLLRETNDFLLHHAKSQGVQFDLRIETDGLITGYRGELVQVLSNLLLNALDATASGGKISIHLYSAAPWLCSLRGRYGYCITVADSGSGILPKHVARIFEPFFTTKSRKGTGLGLWLCMGMINRVGGSIRVRSTPRAGRSGTCFTIFLPAEGATYSPRRRRYESANPQSA